MRIVPLRAPAVAERGRSAREGIRVDSVRNRLAVLAAPLGINLPDAYVAYMEGEPKAVIPVWHLCAPGSPPWEWQPASIADLEADIHGGKWRKAELFAHYLRAAATEYLSGGWMSIGGPGRTEFSTERLGRGFWIGEVDGDHVFLDHETLGVFCYLEQADVARVERWASSFAEFAAFGQQRPA